MSYEALIKRAKQVIHDVSMRAMGASVHRVTIDDPVEGLAGLVIVMHPDYTRPAEIDQKRGVSHPPDTKNI